MMTIHRSGRSWLLVGLMALVVTAALLVLVSRWPRRGRVSVAGANVVVIMVDALRADHLGCYGYELPTSPFMDELAARSVLFDNVTSPASHTVPSVVSTMTGVYPRRHGNQFFSRTASVRAQREAVRTYIPEDLPTLAEEFAALGYRTGAVVTNPWLKPEYGFGRGFERYHYLTDPDRGPYTRGPAVNRIAAELLWEWRDQRFLLYLHYMDVHAPYVPPQPYRREFGEPYAGGRLALNDGPTPDVSELDVAFTRAMYDGEIRGLDDLVAGVFRGLEALGLGDRTLVVLTGDHGDEFYEHGGLGHGWTLYEEVIRPPLLLFHPSLAPLAGRIAAPVSLVDLAPTLLDLAGGATSSAVEGLSLASLIVAARDRPDDSTRIIFSELGTTKAARGPRFKVIRDTVEGAEMAFDLVVDPTESVPLAANAPDVDDLRLRLDTFLAGTRQLPTPRADEIMDADTAARLRALGYGD